MKTAIEIYQNGIYYDDTKNTAEYESCGVNHDELLSIHVYHFEDGSKLRFIDSDSLIIPQVETTRFGMIDVDGVIECDTILGFPDCKHWTLVDEEKAKPFRMLQSLDRPDVALVLIDPMISHVGEGYQFQIDQDLLDRLETDIIEEIDTYVIVTMAKEIQDVSCNLRAPILIGQCSLKAEQIILPGYPVCELILKR